MKLAELARDPALVPRKLPGEERSARGGFIDIRVRSLRAAASDPTTIPDADIPGLRTQLTREIGLADAAFKTILGRVNGDTAAKKLLSLEAVDSRMVKRYLKQGLVPGTLQAMRQRLVRFIVWWAVANDGALLDPAKVDDLHLLVDRRLRMAERMLYDVGRVEGWERAWSAKAVRADPAKPWPDGWNRMFEYPRIPQRLGTSGDRRQVFKGVCNPNANGDCQSASMADWEVHGVDHLVLKATTRLNASAAPFWQRPPGGANKDYTFFLKYNPAPTADPVQAIEQLFTPSSDFKARNLLFCDHVIHTLHLEALLFAQKKRSPSPAWLTNLVNAKPPGWLRIKVPFTVLADKFLAGKNEPTFFEYLRIHKSQLQIADHLIVYNHPAYEKATVGGVWRLENAIVVQVYPELLLQGHGTNPLTLDTMKQQMIGLFNNELERLRQHVRDHIKAGNAATEIKFGSSEGTLVQRWVPAISLYSASNRRADWWLRWEHDDEKDEAAIAASPTRSALARRIHKIEYDGTYGYFPLWEPVLKANKSPVTDSSGKISRIQQVQVTADMVAAWTWFLPESLADRNKLAVIRPKV